MSTECNKCVGKGLIGNGEKPWLMEGHIRTCDQCAGTGKIEDPTPAPIEAPVAPETPSEKKSDEPAPRRGILSIFNR